MSYILDALRKADAQRERDPARGIHAQPLRGSAGTSGARNGPGPWLWGAAAGVAALGSAGWFLYQDSGQSESKLVIQAAPVVPAATPTAATAAVLALPAPVVGVGVGVAPPLPPPVAPVPVVAVAIEPPAPPRPPAAPARDPRGTSLPTMRGNQVAGAPGSGPSVTAQLPAGTSPTPAAPAAVPLQPGLPAPAGVPMTPPPVPGSVPGLASPPGVAPGAIPPQPPPVQPPPPPPPPPPPGPFRMPPPAPPAPPAQPVAGLPADAPKLVISGGVYSTNPVQRMLIVNGQVFNEGSEVGTGVVLEEIKPKGAVLRFRGSRYTVGY